MSHSYSVADANANLRLVYEQMQACAAAGDAHTYLQLESSCMQELSAPTAALLQSLQDHELRPQGAIGCAAGRDCAGSIAQGLYELCLMPD